MSHRHQFWLNGRGAVVDGNQRADCGGPQATQHLQVGIDCVTIGLVLFYGFFLFYGF